MLRPNDPTRGLKDAASDPWENARHPSALEDTCAAPPSVSHKNSRETIRVDLSCIFGDDRAKRPDAETGAEFTGLQKPDAELVPSA